MANNTPVPKPIYLDHQATTPVDERVIDEMLPTLREHFGNASSGSHAFGWAAEDVVDLARERIAALIGAEAPEIVFTSGATESDNLAILGAARRNRNRGRRIVTVETEHKAVLEPCRRAEQDGFEVIRVGVDADGLIDLDALNEAIDDETILVSIMFANNETGVVQPIGEIGSLCRERGALFHTDAAQAVGKTPIDVDAMHIDLMSISAHKMYGPKGVGALFIRRRHPRARIDPLLIGGGQQNNLRSGTLNTPGAAGLGKACEIAAAQMDMESNRLRAMRDRLQDELIERLGNPVVNGHREKRLPHALNISFPGVDGDALITGLPDLAVSSGAACASVDPQPSHVLRAMGVEDAMIRSSIRIGLGRFTTEEEVQTALDRVVETVKRLREARPSATETSTEIGAKT